MADAVTRAIMTKAAMEIARLRAALKKAADALYEAEQFDAWAEAIDTLEGNNDT